MDELRTVMLKGGKFSFWLEEVNARRMVGALDRLWQRCGGEEASFVETLLYQSWIPKESKEGAVQSIMMTTFLSTERGFEAVRWVDGNNPTNWFLYEGQWYPVRYPEEPAKAFMRVEVEVVSTPIDDFASEYIVRLPDGSLQKVHRYALEWK